MSHEPTDPRFEASNARGGRPRIPSAGTTTTQIARLPGTFHFEDGNTIDNIEVAYGTWGNLDATGSNAVLICHPMTCAADADVWWADLFGTAFDPAVDFIVCPNALGSCYGTTGPISLRDDGTPWGPDFPDVSIRDGVALQARLLDHLGVRRLRLVIGGSMGGMLALEWPLMFPERVDAAVIIACTPRHSPWCIGWSEAQRQALAVDPKWRDGRYPADDPPRVGLAAARKMAMLSYRSWPSLEGRFGRRQDRDGEFKIGSWLQHHGEALVDRFDANTYVTLTRAMDSHDITRGRGNLRDTLRRITQPVLIVSIDSDVLYPPVEQQQLAELLPNAEFFTLRSDHGHDGFLIDTASLADQIADFRREARWAA